MIKKGKLILILGPSGVGKGTLISLLKERKNPEKYFFPVSCTTRKPRIIKETGELEKDGENYFFLSKEEFEEKIEKGEMLEHALVHGKAYYGLMKKPIMDAISEGKIVIREADVQGFDSISEILDKEVLGSIFIDIPEIRLLKNRIRDRAPILEDELNARVESVKMERKYKKKTDFVIKNIEDGVERMYKDLEFKINAIEKFNYFNLWNDYKKVVNGDNKFRNFEEGEIWWVNVGLNIGSEIDGKGEIGIRPVYVLKKFGNRQFLGIPLSTQKKYGKFILNKGQFNLKKDSDFLFNQIKTFSSNRLFKNIGKVSNEKKLEIKEKAREDIF